MVLEEDEKEIFKQVYQTLKMELLEDPAFEYDDASHQWLNKMMDYTVPKGKLNRGTIIIESYKLLNEGKQSEDEFYKACIIAWCIQWAIASALVLDDISDDSHTRRGKPCWFRQPKVGKIALNDGILLSAQAMRILKKHFKDHPCYVELLELYHEVTYQSACGQLMDLIIPLEVDQERGLMNYTKAVQQHIHLYKTAYAGFYAPFASALLLLGKKLDEFVEEKNILLEMGIFFQVQDDYLDCFGDPEIFGKVGSDIEEGKCSWLVMKALELCNEDQKKLLRDNYKKADTKSVNAVKSLYKDLNLEKVFAEYEADLYDKLVLRIEALPSQTMNELFKIFLHTIYKRQI